MLVHVSSLGERPAEGSADGLAVSGTAPVVLSLQLAEDERLAEAWLAVRRRPTTAISAQPELGTSATASLTSITWVTGRWSQPRELRGLRLVFTSKPNPLVVRVHVARGGGGWFLPPGVHTFTLGAAMQLQAALPDVVAERVLVEFLDPQGVPVSVSLSANEPLTVELGNAPRDLALAVQGRRPFLRWSGAIPEGTGLVVDDLRVRLEAELRGEVRARTVALELRSEVGGEVDLEWAFDAVRTLVRFDSPTARPTLSIPWAGVVHIPLLDPGSPSTEILALGLSIAATPVAEELVLGSGAAPSFRDGQLVRPLYDAALSLDLRSEWRLTGFDVFARVPSGTASVTLALHSDDDGRPAAAAGVELPRAIDVSTSEPTWITFDLGTTLSVPTGRWWLALRVDEGELVWLTVASPDGGRLLCRRDRGPWQPRTSLDGVPVHGIMRARAAGRPPTQPVSLSVIGAGASGQVAWEAPLSIDEDGRATWSVGSSPPPPVSALSLRVEAEVATTVVLSNLELIQRPSTP